MKSQKLSNDLLQNWEDIFPIAFYYDHLPEQEIKEINAAIFDYYHKSELIWENLTMVRKFWFYLLIKKD